MMRAAILIAYPLVWAYGAFAQNIPADCEGVLKTLGKQGDGEEVSFDAILRKYGLTDPALALLAQIVRAADSHPSSPHPAGEGLRWIAHGFSTLGLSDHQILEQEFIVYNALYAECNKRVAA